MTTVNSASFEKTRALTEALQQVVKKHGLDPYDALAALIPVVADNVAAYAMGELESNLQGPAPSREAILREVESEKEACKPGGQTFDPLPLRLAVIRLYRGQLAGQEMRTGRA